MVLEIMDALAADVSYKYVKGTELEESSSMVTVAVDNIHFNNPILSSHDIMFNVTLLIVYS